MLTNNPYTGRNAIPGHNNKRQHVSIRFKLLADKLAYLYSHAPESSENINQVLNEIMELFQNELNKHNPELTNWPNLLQKRHEKIAERILKR